MSFTDTDKGLSHKNFCFSPGAATRLHGSEGLPKVGAQEAFGRVSALPLPQGYISAAGAGSAASQDLLSCAGSNWFHNTVTGKKCQATPNLPSTQR